MQTQVQILPTNQAPANLPQTPQALTETRLRPLLGELSKDIAERTGCNADLIEQVAGIALGAVPSINTEREADLPKLALFLAAEIRFCAATYTGDVKTTELALDEMIRFTLEKFGHLGPSEIREAFRMAASGHAFFADVDLAAYHGVFTINALGKVLATYNNYRNTIISEVQAIESRTLGEVTTDSRRQEWDPAGWSTRRVARLRELLSLGELTVELVTVADWVTFVDGKIEFPEAERRLDWEEAWNLTMCEVSTLAANDYTARRELQQVRAGQKSEYFSAKRIFWYKRLLALRWARTVQPTSI